MFVWALEKAVFATTQWSDGAGVSIIYLNTHWPHWQDIHVLCPTDMYWIEDHNKSMLGLVGPESQGAKNDMWHTWGSGWWLMGLLTNVHLAE